MRVLITESIQFTFHDEPISIMAGSVAILCSDGTIDLGAGLYVVLEPRQYRAL